MNNVLCSVNKNGTCELIAHNGHLSISTTIVCTTDKSFQVLLPFKQIQSIASTRSGKELYRLHISPALNFSPFDNEEDYRYWIRNDYN